MFAIKHFHSSSSIVCSCRTLQALKKPIHSVSTVVLTKDETEKKDIQSEYPSLDTRFNQYQIAYRYRRNAELLRGYLVYRLFSINFLVNNQAKIAAWGQRILGTRLFNSILKLTAFGHFVGGETPREIQPVINRLQKYGVKPILDYSVESDDAGSSTTKKDKTVESFQQSISSYFTKSQDNASTDMSLTRDELSEIHDLLLRLNRIAQACVARKISIMVDAEQTYFQTAINYLATELQRYYNRSSDAYIYGTYQCYLKETFNSLTNDLAQSEKQNYIFAAKLVRGAYMEQERRLARERGYEDPINPNFETTSNVYHACLDEVLKNIVKRETGQVRVMVASHNEDTIRYAIQKMKDNNIHRGSSLISFASLYGMSDYVGFALANSGYDTYKYLPYGPIESLQPYLFRRAQENRAVFEKADKDRRLHLKALKDRVLHAKV